jgi:hypothetical protein
MYFLHTKKEKYKIKNPSPQKRAYSEWESWVKEGTK